MANTDYEEARRALNHIDPNSREIWFRMGAAVHSEFGQEGFAMWDEWAKGGEKYNAKDAKDVWNSCRAGRINIGTLFWEAKNNGFSHSQEYSQPSPELLQQREISKKEREAQAATQEIENQKKRDKTTYISQKRWEKAAPADPNHPYLVAKGIASAEVLKSIRQEPQSGKLLIPMYQNNKLVSVQEISQDMQKTYPINATKSGSAMVIGDRSKIKEGYLVAEGFATGATLHETSGKPVIVAFDAGNVKRVAEKLAETMPTTPVTFCADNDAFNAKNDGVLKAEAAAGLFHKDVADVVYPVFSEDEIKRFQEKRTGYPSDFNDLAELRGKESVSQYFSVETEPQKGTNLDQGNIKQLMNETGDIQKIESALDTEGMPPPPPFPDDLNIPELYQEQPHDYNFYESEAMTEAPQNQTKATGEVKEPVNSITVDESPKKAKEAEVVINATEAAPNATKQVQQGSAKGEHVSPTVAPSVATQTINNNQDDKEIVTNTISLDDSPVQTPRRKLFEKEEPSAIPLTKQDIEKREPITDVLEPPKAPPSAIQSRYVVTAKGEYIDAQNGRTVAFNDKGKSLTTSKDDLETVRDMLEVAKSKNWERISLKGSLEFKRLAFLEAESQGIPTKGYAPTIADKAMVERMRADRQGNQMEQGVPRVKDLDDPKRNQTIAADKKMEAEAESAAARLMAKASQPTTAEINSSVKADNNLNQPIKDIGAGTINSEVALQAQEMKRTGHQAANAHLSVHQPAKATSAAKSVSSDDVAKAKQQYDAKAANLNQRSSNMLKSFEANSMDVIRHMDDSNKNLAMLNFYENTQGLMKGKSLNLPNMTERKQEAQKPKERSAERQTEQVMNISRGR